MEKLSRSIFSLVECGNWKPVSLCRGAPPISYLIFADDLLLFSGASSDSVCCMDGVLSTFANLSGLRINPSKSTAFASKALTEQTRNHISTLLNIQFSNNVGMYLGFPISHGRVVAGSFSFLLDKLRAKLTVWKRALLNKAGRLTLCRAVLAAIPAYSMQISWLPNSICTAIDRFLREFIWKDSKGHGLHLVAWTKVAAPRSMGGLGLRTTRDFNIALLGKLYADIVLKRNKLWTQIIIAKYGCEGPHLQWKPAVSPVFRGILQAAEQLEEGFRLRVGDGGSSFWYSSWLPGGPIASRIQYVHVADTKLRLCDCYGAAGWDWNRLYSLVPPEIKTEVCNYGPLVLRSDCPDKWCWSSNLNGDYTVKEGYVWRMKRREQGGSVARGWIWRIPAPEKVQLLLWLASYNAIPTNSLRHRRLLSASPLCTICGDEEETWTHVFFRCPWAKMLWEMVDPIIARKDVPLQWDVASDSLYDMCKGWGGAQWAALWCIWIERNARCMRGIDRRVSEVATQVSWLAITLDRVFAHRIKRKSVCLVGWNPRRGGNVILHVDGSSLGNPGQAGFGGVIRDDNGKWIDGFMGSIGIAGNLAAELHGLWRGLCRLRELGWNSACCYSDSTEAIRLAGGGASNSHMLWPLIMNIQQVLRETPGFKLYHILREGNAVADGLAKRGAKSIEFFTTWAYPPDDVKSALSADCAGVLFPRV